MSKGIVIMRDAIQAGPGVVNVSLKVDFSIATTQKTKKITTIIKTVNGFSTVFVLMFV